MSSSSAPWLIDTDIYTAVADRRIRNHLEQMSEVARMQQSPRMPQRLQFAGPMVRWRASLDPHQAWRQLLEKRQDVPAPQLTPHDHLAGCINAVHLKAPAALLRGFGDLLLQVAGLMITAELAQRCLVQLK